MTATDSDTTPRTEVTPGLVRDPEVGETEVRDPEVVQVVRRRRSEQERKGRGARRRPGARGLGGPRTVWWQLASTIVFVVLLAVMAVVGYRASRLITGGGTDRVTDPDAPGFVAEVRPTPVDLVAVTTDDGALAGVVIAAASGDGGGTVSALPATISAGPGEDGLFPPIADAYAAGGLDQLRSVLGTGLTFGFTSAEEVSASDLTTLAGVVGPLTIKNVDNLIDSTDRGVVGMDPDKESVRYRAGEVTLEPGELAEFLAFSGIGEEPDRQMLRHLAVWEQLLAGIATKDMSSLATSSDGTSEDGGLAVVADLMADLGGGAITYEPVPLVQQPIPGTYFTTMIPDEASLPTYVARVVPFPTSATPGQRARVELLNGTTNDQATLLVAPKVVAAGGEISLLGNADSFDKQATEVQYLAPEAREAAEEIAGALGVKATVSSSASGGVDVRVIVGADRNS